jgi:pyrroline-5-carboxylate reductase
MRRRPMSARGSLVTDARTIAFIGVGRMGAALARGLVASGTAPKRIVASDADAETARRLGAEIGIRVTASNVEAAAAADTVVLAVKPQVAKPVLQELASALTQRHALVSIAAGISAAQLAAWSGLPPPRIVRTMPNTPCLVGAGAVAMAVGPDTDADAAEAAREVFGTTNLAVTVDERLIDAVTGLSGSGPAYVFLFLEALADGGVAAGLARDTAQALAAQTVLGAATMVAELNAHPAQLKDQVASPGGTTIAGLRMLEERGFRSAVIEAVQAAARRSKELSEVAG